ncbi:SPOR domain-containing protein [Endozoicomonas ascidiicola]|uniref:SPOR domain-containing protein n=1 Tax=Endozoicomonas ascidiicola TaxID=1698521 RepID=UPI00082C0C29|nr:SPOR domain-containing protein [Endozoicomonas ascidiicola]
MGEGLKQRLFGAVVLLALLIILAPALFKGGESHPMLASDNDAVPLQAPSVPVFVEQLDVPAEPVSVAIRDEVQEVELDPVPTQNTGTDEKGHLKAWSLRLATFSDKSNADNLEKNLKKKGYSAYINKVTTDSGSYFYRVYIGPEARPDDFQRLKASLKKEMGLDGMIVRFQP